MTVPVGSNLIVKCANKYHLIGHKTSLCDYDGWTEPLGRCLSIFKHCKKYLKLYIHFLNIGACEPRVSTAFMSINCTLNNVLLKDCKKPVEGTIASFKCSDFYEDLSLATHPIHICTKGEWSYELPQCEPSMNCFPKWSDIHIILFAVCGQKRVKSPTLIVNGDNVTRGDYPWQVAIYNKTNEVLICGGALVNQRVILTGT